MANMWIKTVFTGQRSECIVTSSSDVPGRNGGKSACLPLSLDNLKNAKNVNETMINRSFLWRVIVGHLHIKLIYVYLQAWFNPCNAQQFSDYNLTILLVFFKYLSSIVLIQTRGGLFDGRYWSEFCKKSPVYKISCVLYLLGYWWRVWRLGKKHSSFCCWRSCVLGDIWLREATSSVRGKTWKVATKQVYIRMKMLFCFRSNVIFA